MHAKKKASEPGRRGRGRAAPLKSTRPATIEAVLTELERAQHMKVVLRHLAGLLMSEFTGEGDQPPKIKVGVDAVGAVPVREEVLDAVHELLLDGVREAERRQRALLASKVDASVLVAEADGPSSLAVTSTIGLESPRPTKSNGLPRDRFLAPFGG